MRPELFRLLDISAPSYFMLLVSGFIFATTMGVVWARRIGENPDVIVDLGLFTLLVGGAGARILHVLADGYFWDYVHLCTDPSLVDVHLPRVECVSPDYVWDTARQLCYPAKANCFRWAEFWSGGLTYYGGFIGAAIASWYLLKRDRFPFWRAADMAGFVVPVGLAFGRMGCLLAGCCFGLKTDSALGLVFPSNSPASESQFKAGELASLHMPSLPVLPTQIFESAASLAIAAVCLLYVHSRKRYDGQVFLAFVALYASARFVLEFWRSDDRGGFFGLSTSQLIGIVLAGLAVAFDQRLRRAAENRAKGDGTKGDGAKAEAVAS
jgi:phosphatidylglycerol:prolipoprotein diacylglycerol transferase